MNMKQGAILLGLLGVALIAIALGSTWMLLRDDRPDVNELRTQAARQSEDSTPSPPPTAEAASIVERAIRPGGLIDISIERFVLRVGRHPTTLQDLVTRPSDLATGESWDGPYINNPHLIRDPWGNEYLIKSPGTHNPSGYDLWSKGPDGVNESADDIGNW